MKVDKIQLKNQKPHLFWLLLHSVLLVSLSTVGWLSCTAVLRNRSTGGEVPRGHSSGETLEQPGFQDST